MTQRTPVSILGATGLVGQRFAARLAHHPWFEVAHLAAGPRSVGKSYGEACRGRARPELAESGLVDVEVVPCTPRAALAPIVFSALDRPVALELEPAFARAGATVFSNAAAFRMEGDVPLLVPEVNGEHLELLADQRRGREWPGAIVCNPNCTTAVLVTALAPLHRAFGLEALSITSLQAASGAGFAGVSAVELSGNVLPYIEGEEEKLARETQRILGSLVGGRVEPLEAAVSAACHRVDVLDGHTLSVSARFRGNPSPERVRAALAAFVPEATAGLPSAPRRPVSRTVEPTCSR